MFWLKLSILIDIERLKSFLLGMFTKNLLLNYTNRCHNFTSKCYEKYARRILIFMKYICLNCLHSNKQ